MTISRTSKLRMAKRADDTTKNMITEYNTISDKHNEYRKNSEYQSLCSKIYEDLENIKAKIWFRMNDEVSRQDIEEAFEYFDEDLTKWL